MAVTYTNLITPTYVPNSQTTLFTADSNTICSVVITNPTGSTATLELSVVDSGGTATDDKYIIIPTMSLATLEKLIINGIVMENGDFISAISGTNNALTVRVQGADGLP